MPAAMASPLNASVVSDPGGDPIDTLGLLARRASGNMRRRRQRAGMATNDTDPQRTKAFADDGSRTEPGAPPLADDAADGPSNAASLLAGLAQSAQPQQDVRETEGHVAAAYAAAPHRPPRANDKTVENPAVFINATVPLPEPPSSGRQKLGPPAAPFVRMNGAPTVPGGARLFEGIERNETTDPGERTKNQVRLYLACIAGIVVAGLIAVGILVLVQRSAPAPSTSIPSPSLAPTVVDPQPVVSVVPSSASSPSSSTTASPPASSPASTIPAVTTKPPPHSRPQGSSSPSPRHSGNFAEPDRNL